MQKTTQIFRRYISSPQKFKFIFPNKQNIFRNSIFRKFGIGRTQMDFEDMDEYNEFMRRGFRTIEGEEAHIDPREVQRVARDLVIDKRLYRMQYARSSGPGGQHVNTTDSKAVLFLRLDDNPYLDGVVKKRLEKRFDYLITK